MKPVLIAFASREGQTRRIAEHVATAVRARGDRVDVVDVASTTEGLDVGSYAAVVLAASVHLGKHEREMIAFVQTHRGALERVPTAFLSVSLSEAGVEDATAPFEKRSRAAIDVKKMVDDFCAAAGFHPDRIWPVAGALMYSEYGVVTRLVMRMIAKRQGASTDTSHDQEYTDWRALDRFVGAVMAEVEASGSHGVAASDPVAVAPPSHAR